MDWGRFFEETRIAAKVESFAKLAPLLHITDGAISHYRTGRSVPSAWTVAACLRIQGHADPEREAARIMQHAATDSHQRAFWRRLGAVAGFALCAVLIGGIAAPSTTYAAENFDAMHLTFRMVGPRSGVTAAFTTAGPTIDCTPSVATPVIEAEELTRDLLHESRCVCVTDGVLTLAVWQNPDDVDETGQCQMVAVPEIRVLPVAHLISRIRALGWSEGFSNPTHPA